MPETEANYFVYVLRSSKDQHFYIGMTNNVERRLREHNSGKVRSTRFRRPFSLILVESLPSRQEEAKRERFLKSGPGHQFLARTVVDSNSAPTSSG